MAHGASLRSLAKDDRPRSSREVAGRLIGYLTPYRRQTAAAVVWVVLAAAANAAAPAITGRIVNVALEANRTGQGASVLTAPMLLLIATIAVGWWSQRLQILVLGTVGQRALFGLREQVFGKVQHLSVAFFESAGSGDIMSRLVNDIETLNSFLSQGFRRVLGAGVGLVATLAGMLIVDWHLAVATLLVVPLMLLATRLFGAVARRAFRRRQEAIGDVSATLAEEIAGMRVAQAFDRTAVNRVAFSERNAANRDANIAASAVSSAFTPTLAIISAVATAVVAALGGVLTVRDVVTVGVVVAFFNYSRQFFNAVSQLSSLYTETQSALAGGERVFDLLDAPVEVTDSPDAIALGRVTGRIELTRVWFRYGDGPAVLRDVDLEIEPGTTVAVVGPTGAGKTTLVNLLARFYDPVDGSVSVDGHDLREVTVASLRRNLGIVLQEPFLFAGTIAENIRYGRLDASADDVRSAAEAARALEFVERLPHGLDTLVGERGGTLSTGQRQLVAFARAVLADPAILILDEATSSVDTRTEILIQGALRSILAERTSVVIAHRLSTVRDADRIVVIDDGRIVEDGTYAGLLAQGGLFRRLHDAQFAE